MNVGDIMKIGFIFALDEELEAFKNKLDVVKENEIYDLKIYECNYKNVDCYLIKCGIGKVNAGRVTQILISEYNVDYIINMGVAGSVTKDINTLDVVVGEKLVQHDLDVTLFGHEKGEIPYTGKFFSSDAKLVDIAKKIGNVNVGVIASGDQFISDQEQGEKIHEDFDALCVEMEGAAIAQVCSLCNVPFIVIRAISDSIYGDNKVSFEEFLVKSSNEGSKFLIKLLNKFIV